MMTRLRALLALAVTTGTAAADPCVVTIARAPDDVKASIEKWIGQETRCTTKLEVRVVETTGGYYIIARDDRGRLHERVVPSVDSAGVLVASWAADDTIEPKPDPEDTIKAIEALPESDPNWADTTSAPGEVMPMTVDRPPPPKAKLPPRLYGAGLLVGMSDGGGWGGRFEVDLGRSARWVWSFAIGMSTDSFATMTGQISTLDVKTGVNLARKLYVGPRWDLRAGGGVGYALTDATQVDGTSVSGATPFAEVSARLSRSFGNGDWSIGAGPIITLYAQSYREVDRYGNDHSDMRSAELVGFFSLQRGM